MFKRLRIALGSEPNEKLSRRDNVGISAVGNEDSDIGIAMNDKTDCCSVAAPWMLPQQVPLIANIQCRECQGTGRKLFNDFPCYRKCIEDALRLPVPSHSIVIDGRVPSYATAMAGQGSSPHSSLMQASSAPVTLHRSPSGHSTPMSRSLDRHPAKSYPHNITDIDGHEAFQTGANDLNSNLSGIPESSEMPQAYGRSETLYATVERRQSMRSSERISRDA